MGHLVTGDVELGQGVGVACTVTVGHLGTVPERVLVGVSVVDPRPGADTVVPDAVAAQDELEVVEGLLRAVVGVNPGRSPVGDRVVAPDVVGVGELCAGAGGGSEEVSGVVVHRVAHLKVGSGTRGANGHIAYEDAVAGAVLDVVDGQQRGARLGVDDGMQPAGGLVGPDARCHHVVGQLRGGLLGGTGVDDQFARGGRAGLLHRRSLP